MCIPFALLHSMRFCRPPATRSIFFRVFRVFRGKKRSLSLSRSLVRLNLGSSMSRLLWPDPRVRD